MTNKTCSRCKQLKSTDNFYWRKTRNTYMSYCKECGKNLDARKQDVFKLLCLEYLGSKSCVKCGYSKCIAALEFHHIDPEQKEFSISHRRANKLSDQTKKELDKCIVVCSNCHREQHYKNSDNRGGFDITSGPIQTINKLCESCGKKVCKSSKLCLQCNSSTRLKIHWPTKEELLTMLASSSYSAVGRNLGVSDNAIRKHLNK